ncbi:MAG TPA: NADH-quinone oxidoreductase subunit C [Ignavibacteriaceae bacterium]|nr:NADH-quinone oxidoreductase subunit C [Ignavibacteriaceae bacterium]
MNWIESKNSETFSIKDMPVLKIDELTSQLIKSVKDGKRLIQFFGVEDAGKIILHAVTADDNLSKIYTASSLLDPGSSYDSLTPSVPSAFLFEREFYEQFGIKPEGHPWLKPVRKGIRGIDKEEIPYEFFKMSGEEVHEVGVGPVHAGIIEPGHFRFSCHGEIVHHLEIELGFQHRGIEHLFIKNSHRPLYMLKLAESIAGDTMIGHAGTFARCIESLSDAAVSKRAKFIRTIMLELERIGNHLGDLSALSNDVAYLTGNAAFGALRTKVINTSMMICGSRFGRSLIAYGGVNFDITPEQKVKIVSAINLLKDEVSLAAEVLFTSASVMERFEKTGIIETETAAEIGMVGPAGRASGLSLDIRSDHPFEAFEYFPFHKLTLRSGDVFARAYIRFIEVQQSIKIINELIENLPEGELNKNIPGLKEDSLVISMTEGWRGEISHVILTDNTGKIKRVTVKDPSFNNWFGLALAVRNEGISDFPLCNKSFNLSYCGFDL